MGMRHFLVRNGQFAPNKTAKEKSLKFFSSTNWTLSLCKTLKKIMKADADLWGFAIFGRRMAHFPKQGFF